MATALSVLVHGYTVTGQPLTSGARSAALAGATVAVIEDEWSSTNPASLSLNEQWRISLFASQGYGLKDLQLASAHFALPGSTVGLAFQIQSFGSRAYRDTQIRLIAARPLFLQTVRPLYAGISIKGQSIHIEGYGKRNTVSLSAGLIFEVWHKMHAGISWSHFIQSRTPLSLPEVIRSGIAYRMTKSTLFLVALEKEPEWPLSFSIGLEHEAPRLIVIRTGMATHPYRFSTGLAVHLKSFSFGLAFEKHYVLGWTPALSIDLFT